MAAKRGSIFEGLPSFEFGANLPEEFKKYIFLRDRSYFLHCNMTAHAAYFLGMLKNLWSISYPEKKLVVGLIGYGVTAANLVASFIEYCEIEPSEILFSLGYNSRAFAIEEKGVKILEDHCDVAKRSDVLFICCTPDSLDTVSVDIRGKVKGIVYSLVNAIPTKKVGRLLMTNKVFHPKYKFNEDVKCDSSFIKKPCTINNALALAKLREMTCPLLEEGERQPVYVETSYVSFLLAVPIYVNLGLPADRVLEILFDDYGKNEEFGNLLEKYADIIKNENDEESILDIVNRLQESFESFYVHNTVAKAFKIKFMKYFDRLTKLKKDS